MKSILIFSMLAYAQELKPTFAPPQNGQGSVARPIPAPQAEQPAPAAPAAPVPAKQSSWVFLGTQSTASTHPQPAGFAAVALPIGSDTWSWSQYSVYLANGKPVTATTTGLAKKMWCLPWACVIGIGTVGSAQSGTSVTAAFNGGGGVHVPKLGKWPVALFVGALQVKAAGANQTQVLAALGRSW
jgi:hypothetical protein